MGKRTVLIYDVDNIGGGVNRAEAVLNLLDLPKLEAITLLIIGDAQTAYKISDLATNLGHLESSTRINKEEEELFLGFHIGQISRAWKDVSSEKSIYLVSSDKRLASLLVPLIKSGYDATIVGYHVNLIRYPNELIRIAKKIDLSKFLVSKEITPIKLLYQFDCSTYPYCFDRQSEERILPYLKVISFPNWASPPIPVFIPLPLVPDEIRVGDRPEKVDLPLAYWDQKLMVRGKQPKYVLNLYSPHAFFGKDTRGWYIRSAKGHRKKDRGLLVNRNLIDSGNGNLQIASGDIIQFGNFTFEFILPPIETGSPSLVRIERTTDLLTYIERSIYEEIITFLKERAHRLGVDWWSSVPEEIRANCETRKKDSGNRNEHPSHFLMIVELDRIAKTYWVEIKQKQSFFHAWLSKTQWQRAIGTFNSIRNKVAHPIRAELTEEENHFIQDLGQYCIRTRHQSSKPNMR